MTLKIKCTYVAEGEPFTLGKKYCLYYLDDGVIYIKDDTGKRITYVYDGITSTLDGLLEVLHAKHHANFTPCVTLEPEKDIKKEVHKLLDKVTELIYNNQEELKIDYMDFITLVKIKDEVKK